MDFLFDVEEVLESFFDGGIGGGEFEKDVSFLEVGGGVMEFEIVDREDVVGNEVAGERRHVGLFEGRLGMWELVVCGVVVSCCWLVLLLVFKSNWILSW